MPSSNTASPSGVPQLDRLLDGLFIGDNVVWYDDAGSLAAAFWLRFVRAAQEADKPVIFVSFDRSPKNLIEKLGDLAAYPRLTILDCFTHGKGEGSDVFMKFYLNKNIPTLGKVVRMEHPRQMEEVMEILYGAHAAEGGGDVRFVFESLTGMQELWGGEEEIINFYAHSCPRLYELNTIAYWVIEKRAHSPRLRARINQVAQVVIDLSLRRGKSALNILKADKRDLFNLNQPYAYWVKNGSVRFEFETPAAKPQDPGSKVRQWRNRRGLSQTELARQVGVTPSTISQVENGLIYPSLPAIFKMAEVLAVPVSAFFEETPGHREKAVLRPEMAIDVAFQGLPVSSISGKRLAPAGFPSAGEAFLIEVAPQADLPAHFFQHKGEEMGYVLDGDLEMDLAGESPQRAGKGDLIHLTSQMPTRWRNVGGGTARMLWIKIR